MKTPEEIKEEIAKLRAVKPHVRGRTFFGDNNHEAIEVQISVLEDDLDEDDVYRRWDMNDFLVGNAMQAVGWRNEDDDLITQLAEEWAELTRAGNLDAYYPA